MCVAGHGAPWFWNIYPIIYTRVSYVTKLNDACDKCLWNVWWDLYGGNRWRITLENFFQFQAIFCVFAFLNRQKTYPYNIKNRNFILQLDTAILQIHIFKWVNFHKSARHVSYSQDTALKMLQLDIFAIFFKFHVFVN